MSSNIRVQRICQYCQITFEARTTVTKTCSDNCAKKLYKQKQKLEKVEASNKETEIIKLKPLEDLRGKEFLSITEACQLTGISRRTLYRMMDRNEVKKGKFGKRTIIRRSDIDKLFL